MRITVESRDFRKRINVRSEAKVSDAFQALRIAEETFLPTISGKLVALDEQLNDGDILRLHPVVSGG